jgi:hypothetical protein
MKPMILKLRITKGLERKLCRNLVLLVNDTQEAATVRFV